MPGRIYILLFSLLSFSFLKAQFPNPSLFNTASNATATGTIPVNSNDLNWTAALTNSLGPYVPAVSCGNQAPGNWVTSPYPNANWITYPHNCSANVSEHSCLGNTDEFYRLLVNLPANSCGQAITTPSAYCLSFDFFADNWVWTIYVNGVLTFNNPNGNPYNSWGFSQGGQLTAHLCNNWQVGTNTVIVHVKSGAPSFPGYSGFLAQSNQTVNTSVGVPFSIVTTQTNVSCAGGSNGVASAAPVTPGATINYTWLPVGGNSNIASGLTAGVYTVQASNGNCIAVQTVTITQPPAFTVNVSPSATICAGSTATLAANGANSYTWNTGSASSSITVNTGGNYSVTMSGGGCTTTSLISMVVQSAPNITVSPGSICGNQSVILTAGGASSYTWSTGATTSTASLNSAGNYSISGASSAGCINSTTFNVSSAPMPSITLSASQTLICQGEQVILNAGGATTFSWNTGSTSSSITSSPLTTSVYTVTGANNSCSDTKTITVNVAVSPALTISGNAILCEGSSGVLNVSGANTYTWSTGVQGPGINISPTTNSVYIVVGTNTLTGCSGSAAVNVQVSAVPQLSVNGTKICAGTSGVLTASGAVSYWWSNGSTSNTSSVAPVANSIYTVTGYGTSTFCSSSQTVMAEIIPSPPLNVAGSSVSVCKNSSVSISAYGAANYVWNNGAVDSSITVNPQITTVYTVSTQSNSTGCISTKTVEVKVVPLPDVIITGDSAICENDKTTLKAIGANQYVWSTGAVGSSIDIIKKDEVPVYYVTGKDDQTNCSATDSIRMNESPLCCEFWIPNAFTPNGDFHNEEFGPKTLCKFKEYKMYIFDKWGEKIWSTSDVNEKWNGTFKGEPCQQDVYVYLVRGVRFIPNRVYLEKTGHVALIK